MLPRLYIVLTIALSACAQDVARFDQIVQSYVSGKKFMGTVLVARGGQILFSKGYGSADLEWDVPNTASTKFRLGSITKQFTAASILLLEERGKLKLEDPVKKHMPDAPAAWDKITIFHLLTHSSGIPNFTSFPDYPKLEPFPITPEKLVAFFKDKPLDFAPGEKMSYSNSGYVLLGYLLEKISGETYQKFLQENIFTPLKMQDSGYDSNSDIILHRASGYESTPNGFKNAGYINMTIPFSAGSIYSTTEDLLRWEQGLFGGKLLSAASLKKMTTPYKNNYALGVTVKETTIAHGGGIEGFNTFLVHETGGDLTVVALANVNGNAPQEIAMKLLDTATGKKVELPSERKEITLSSAVLGKLTGTYKFPQGINFYVRLEGDHLTGQMSGQGRLSMSAQSETRFFNNTVDAQMDFTKNDKGEVTDMVLHQGGRDQTAVRTSPDVPERKEITLSPEILARYPGAYQLRPGINMTIRLEAGHLMSDIPGQPPVELFPQAEDKFFLKVVDAEIDFVRNGDGKVTQLVLHQGPVNITAPRQ